MLTLIMYLGSFCSILAIIFMIRDYLKQKRKDREDRLSRLTQPDDPTKTNRQGIQSKSQNLVPLKIIIILLD